MSDMKKNNNPVYLVADDDNKIVYAFRKAFEKEADIITAGNGRDAVAILKSRKPDIAFVDITMPEMDGLTVLKEVGEIIQDIPVMIITGYGTMNTAIEAIQLGAFDYITKPLDINHLRVMAIRALEVVRLKSEVSHLKTAQSSVAHDEYEMIGNHPTMQSLFKKIGMIGMTPNTTNVLLTGESGTGKELAAKAIHRSSPNQKESFIGINCSALPDNLLESELFGHSRGAFTGAIKDQKGKFEAAGKGTIFLDEVGDMPVNLQQKLLRSIEERKYSPIGSTAVRQIHARIIAATNRNLEELMAANNFREDLFYRLNVLALELPALRHKKSDIPLLIDHFISIQNKRLHKNIKGVSEKALELLQRYNYPGNVRELSNIITSAVTLEKGDILIPESLPVLIYGERRAEDYQVPIKSPILKKARRFINDKFEKEFVIHMLKKNYGNVSKAAEQSQCKRQSFQRLMRKFNIKSGDYRV